MRYCLIADIHSNYEAFQSVLDAASGERIDEYLCIGDVVGYAADPQRVIGLLKSVKPSVLIAGNHEWAVADIMGLEYFNEYAREAVIWTRKTLNGNDIDYLRSFKLVQKSDSFTLVHGSLELPEKFNYILSEDDADATIKLMKTSLCFVGHTHVAGTFCSDDRGTTFTRRSTVIIDKKKKYIVNVGSVGQPRDGDPRASYAIYDEGSQVIEIKRVEYDIKAAQKKIIEAGLPVRLATRLSEGA